MNRVFQWPSSYLNVFCRSSLIRPPTPKTGGSQSYYLVVLPKAGSPTKEQSLFERTYSYIKWVSWETFAIAVPFRDISGGITFYLHGDRLMVTVSISFTNLPSNATAWTGPQVCPIYYRTQGTSSESVSGPNILEEHIQLRECCKQSIRCSASPI